MEGTAQWGASRLPILSKYDLGNQIREDETMGHYGGDEKYIQAFGGET